MPKRSRKNRLPCTSWRASASPPGMLVSDSTHIPPTGTNWPVATFSFIRSKTYGRCSSIHAHCCAEDIAKMKSGSSSIRAVTFEAVLATFSDGLSQRPQPGGVDVGVPDGADSVGARHGGRGELRGEHRAGRGGGAGDVLQIQRGVERAFQRSL